MRMILISGYCSRFLSYVDLCGISQDRTQPIKMYQSLRENICNSVPKLSAEILSYKDRLVKKKTHHLLAKKKKKKKKKKKNPPSRNFLKD